MVNRAQIKRDDITDHPARSFAIVGLTNAGKALKPFQFEYQASICLHFYKIPGRDDFAFIFQQAGLPGIQEGQADAGLKELRKQLMAYYGREEKERK